MAVLAVIAAVAAVASAAATSYAVYNQHENEMKQAKYNEQIQRQNAQIATDQANANYAMQERKVQRFLSMQTAAYGATGVQVGQGSPLEVLGDTAYQGELDAQKQLYEGALKAHGYNTQADYFHWVHDRAKSTEWSDTLISGISAGASTYMGAGGKFGGGGGDSAGTGVGPVGSNVNSYGTGSSLLAGIGKVPKYQAGMP
jgi:hypothetical protein